MEMMASSAKGKKQVSSKISLTKKNETLMDEITKIFNENKQRYGVRRVTAELKYRSFIVNHKKVQRIMHKLNLFGKRPKEKYHSYTGTVGKIAENIIERDFKADRPN